MPDNEADAGTGPLQQVTDTGRVEAFSDGVFAIVVTLLVLDLKEPEHAPGSCYKPSSSNGPRISVTLRRFCMSR